MRSTLVILCVLGKASPAVQLRRVGWLTAWPQNKLAVVVVITLLLHIGNAVFVYLWMPCTRRLGRCEPAP
jgi:hypothetical protein